MADEEGEPEGSEEADPRARSSAMIALAMTVVLCGAAIAFFIYYTHRGEELPSQGLDMAEAPAPDPEPAPGASFGLAPPPPQRPSSLMSFKGGPPGSTRTGGDPKAAAQQSLAQVIRPHERFFANLTNKYIAKYPIFNQWGKEWMSYPDLHQACNDYWKYHDPVRFSFQIAGSKNLAGMISKYSGHPELQAFLKEAITSAPKDVVKAGVDYLQNDANATALVKRFASAAGLPPALIAGFAGGQVDQQQVMKQIMDANPSLQGNMQNQSAPPPVR